MHDSVRVFVLVEASGLSIQQHLHLQHINSYWHSLQVRADIARHFQWYKVVFFCFFFNFKVQITQKFELNYNINYLRPHVKIYSN